MPEPDQSFADLLHLARAGDQAALEQLARTYEDDVRIAARVHLGPALRPYLDSLDLVQSVHRSLLLGLRNDKFDVTNPASLIALALTMVRRKVSRQWRRHRRQLRLEPGDADAPIDVLTTLSNRSATPQQASALRDAMARLWRELDAEDRRYLDLLLHGWSSVEAAELMGKTPGALRVRLHRLRKRLEEEGVLADW
jgi:RNA polymerase sigma-70 factor (ECF subfamily)